jgi:hypothetical protein
MFFVPFFNNCRLNLWLVNLFRSPISPILFLFILNSAWGNFLNNYPTILLPSIKGKENSKKVFLANSPSSRLLLTCFLKLKSPLLMNLYFGLPLWITHLPWRAPILTGPEIFDFGALSIQGDLMWACNLRLYASQCTPSSDPLLLMPSRSLCYGLVLFS